MKQSKKILSNFSVGVSLAKLKLIIKRCQIPGLFVEIIENDHILINHTLMIKIERTTMRHDLFFIDKIKLLLSTKYNRFTFYITGGTTYDGLTKFIMDNQEQYRTDSTIQTLRKIKRNFRHGDAIDITEVCDTNEIQVKNRFNNSSLPGVFCNKSVKKLSEFLVDLHAEILTAVESKNREIRQNAAGLQCIFEQKDDLLCINIKEIKTTSGVYFDEFFEFSRHTAIEHFLDENKWSLFMDTFNEWVRLILTSHSYVVVFNRVGKKTVYFAKEVIYTNESVIVETESRTITFMNKFIEKVIQTELNSNLFT